MYDQAEKVYNEIFRKDEEKIKLEVIQEKEDCFRRRKDKENMIREAKEYIDERKFQKECQGQKALLARTNSAATELNRGSPRKADGMRRSSDLRASEDYSEENRFLIRVDSPISLNTV